MLPRTCFVSALSGCAALAALLLAGCDGRPRRVPVAGKILIDGKPLTSGFVQMVPADARPAYGKIQPDGSFRMTTFDEDDGCVPGEHKVTVIAYEPLGATKTRWLVPAKYQDAATTDKTVKIEKAVEDLVIELSWDGGAPFVIDSDTRGDQPIEAPAENAGSDSE